MDISEPTLDYILQPDHVLKACHKSANGVRWKASVQHFEIDRLQWGASVQQSLLDGTYRNKGMKRFDIVERGKVRHIQAEHISDRVVHKLFCDYALKPYLYQKVIYDNSASQTGKGTEFALKRLKEHLRWHYARYGKNGVVIVMDYHDYFNSIPHEGVKQMLTAPFADQRIVNYTNGFVDLFHGDKGLGLGSEISQVGGVIYPTPIDKLVKEQYRIHCYGRYNDDSYIICHDKAYALECLEAIKTKAKETGIEVNDSKTKIHNLASDDFTFLKKRIHITDNGKIVMRITRQNFKREQERIRTQRAEYDAGRMKPESILLSYQAWRSYAKTYDNYRTVGKMDKYFYSIMGDIIERRMV